METWLHVALPQEGVSHVRDILVSLPGYASWTRWGWMYGTGCVNACSRAACCRGAFSRHALQARCGSPGLELRPGGQVMMIAMQKRHLVQVLGGTVCRSAMRR